MCYNPTFYQFSDVANGPTDNDCQDELTYLFNENAGAIATMLIVFGCVGLVGFGMSFGVCYLSKKGLPSNFYKH